MTEFDETDMRTETERQSEEYRIDEGSPVKGIMETITEAIAEARRDSDACAELPVFRKTYTLAIVSEKMIVLSNTYDSMKNMDISDDDPDFRRDWDAAMADIRCGIRKAMRLINSSREKVIEECAYETEDWFKEGLKGRKEDE